MGISLTFFEADKVGNIDWEETFSCVVRPGEVYKHTVVYKVGANWPGDHLIYLECELPRRILVFQRHAYCLSWHCQHGNVISFHSLQDENKWYIELRAHLFSYLWGWRTFIDWFTLIHIDLIFDSYLDDIRPIYFATENRDNISNTTLSFEQFSDEPK